MPPAVVRLVVLGVSETMAGGVLSMLATTPEVKFGGQVAGGVLDVAVVDEIQTQACRCRRLRLRNRWW